jgi:hypothetical protein
VQPGRDLQTFQKCLLSPSSGRYISTSETFVNVYQIARRNTPEGSHLLVHFFISILKNHLNISLVFNSFCGSLLDLHVAFMTICLIL